MNKNQKECLINKLNKINRKIINEKLTREDIISNEFNRDFELKEWIDIELTLLDNAKIMIEKALINDFLEEL